MNHSGLPSSARHLIALALVTMLVVGIVPAQEPAPAATGREGALNAAADARVAALVAGDVAALGAILSDDLHYVHSNGVADTKEAFLANLVSGKTKYVEYAPGERSWRFPAAGIALESGKARSSTPPDR